MNPSKYATFIRFVVAGLVNTMFGWVVYSACVLWGAQPWIALITSTVVGIAFNFVSLGGYAFRDFSLERLPRFVISYIAIYLINLVCLRGVYHWITSPIFAQLILTPPMALLSYLLLSRLVFAKKNDF
jgi:putative flippase GtrA